MAAKRWLGVAPAIKQITTLTIGGTIAVNDVFAIVCGFGTVTVVATSTSTATTATQIQAALANANAPREFSDMVWTVAGSVVTGTGSTAGVPFVVTGSATGSGTVTAATPTAASGPNFANVAANWNGATLPAITDTITVEANSPAILYGLTTITALMGSVTIEAGFNGTIGLPEINAKGYREYRAMFWAINSSVWNIGAGIGFQSNQIKIDIGAVASAVTVFNTGSTGDQTEAPLQIVGGASATLVAAAGSVGIATRATEIANFASIVVGEAASVECGLTCTHTLVRSQGNTRLENIAPTLDVRAGTTTTTGQATAIDISGGTLVYQSSATITTAYVGPGTLDCSDLRARTITTLRMRSTGQVKDPQKTITIGTLLLEAGTKGIYAQ